MASPSNQVLDVRNLNVRFETPDGAVEAVSDLSFTLAKGECLGIVGESGSGKSQTFMAAMGLLADNGKASGEVLFDGVDLLTAGEKVLNAIRGNRASMVFQDHMTSLTPHMKIGRQLGEVLIRHRGMSTAAAQQAASPLAAPCAPSGASTLGVSRAAQWQALFGARARALGWQARAGDGDDERLLRAALLPWVAELGEDAALRADARRLAEAWLADPAAAAPALDASLRGPALATAALDGDAASTIDDSARERRSVRSRKRNDHWSRNALNDGEIHGRADAPTRRARVRPDETADQRRHRREPRL